ncbi:MAG: toxin-antitoxin system TumE family protein, partial [Chloroflexota bacterium]
MDLLASLPFVESPDVNLEKRSELVGFIRGEVEFSDGSTLFFRELIDLRLPLGKMMYAYHYQSLEGALVFRYDNTAHHKSISTFPLHK